MIVLHLPDLVRNASGDGTPEDGQQQTAAEMGHNVEDHARLLCCSLLSKLETEPYRPLVLVLCPWPESFADTELQPLAASCARAAQHLSTSLANSPGPMHVVLPEELKDLIDGAEIFDEVADKLGHIPFSNELQCAIATAAARRLNCEIGQPAIKVLAVDCDNTLWANAVADVGPQGLAIEVVLSPPLLLLVCCYLHHLSVAPDRCGWDLTRGVVWQGRQAEHEELHERIKLLAATGTLVCLCSRNASELVRNAFQQLEHKGLKLQLGRDILNTMVGVSAHGSKADSLRRLALELNLSLSSFAVSPRLA